MFRWFDRFVILPTFDLWSCDYMVKTEKSNVKISRILLDCSNVYFVAPFSIPQISRREPKSFAFKNSFHYSILKFAYFLQEWYDNGLQGYEVHSVSIGWTCLLLKINKL